MNNFIDKCNTIVEQMEIGVTEEVDLYFCGKNTPVLENLTAKVDSGNDGLNVLSGIVISQDDNWVEFKTIDNKVLKMKKHGDIIIHVGAGNKEYRPIVCFDMIIGDKKFKNVQFSIGDRTENDEPILICKDFISSIDCLINVNKNNVLK